jgi:predicted RNase H-like HicB family nuclease
VGRPAVSGSSWRLGALSAAGGATGGLLGLRPLRCGGGCADCLEDAGDGGVYADVPELPEVQTEGADHDDVRAMVRDAIALVLDERRSQRTDPAAGLGSRPTESNMIAIARGSISEPQRLGPFIDDEMGVVSQLKDEGVMKALYRRAAGPGAIMILEGQSMDAIRARADTLPFVVEG